MCIQLDISTILYVVSNYEWEANKFYHDLIERFAKFGLELALDKTKTLEFGRFAKGSRAKRGLENLKPLTSQESHSTVAKVQTRNSLDVKLKQASRNYGVRLIQ